VAETFCAVTGRLTATGFLAATGLLAATGFLAATVFFAGAAFLAGVAFVWAKSAALGSAELEKIRLKQKVKAGIKAFTMPEELLVNL
jgi:arginine exporter protein ArgO